MSRRRVTVCLIAVALLCTRSSFAEPPESKEVLDGNALLADSLERMTREIEENNLADINTIEDWTARRPELHRQLQEMLGLSPWPEKTPLNPRIMKVVEHDDFLVENLVFESRPGLYVTANLYRPREQKGPLPAVLYVCGHGAARIDGVSYGNKTTYHHHGVWFARNGYVALLIDTIQLGEIEGMHHGTYRFGRWDWLSRGYTPAGVEAWNGIRALDYLQSRDEVDPERIGMTGRSGGGAYTWWVAALDERVKVAVPVAGMTSMRNHVVDGCVEGHCDCMYQVNTYQWDYATIAALVAPRPLLISNSDKDEIFPLDGVLQVYWPVRHIYDLYGAEKNLGLNITEGPHQDTQELRVHAFRWLNRFLKNDDSLITFPAEKVLTTQELKVFEDLPEDERVTDVQEWFVPHRESPVDFNTREEFDEQSQRWIEFLNDQCFHGLAAASSVERKTSVQLNRTWEHDQHRLRLYELEIASLRLPLFVIDHADSADVPVHVHVLDESSYAKWMSQLEAGFSEFPQPKGVIEPAMDNASSMSAPINISGDGIHVLVVPRGIGPTAWTGDERKQTQIRRRFYLLGTTLDRLRIEETLAVIEALPEVLGHRPATFALHGNDSSADWAMAAAVLDGSIDELVLANPSTDFNERPILLNLQKEFTPADLTLLAASRVREMRIEVTNDEAANSWQPLAKAAKVLGLGPIEIVTPREPTTEN